MTSFPGPRKPNDGGAMTQEEGDRIANQVLELVEGIAIWRASAPIVDMRREPTGCTFAPAMRSFVEQRERDRPQGAAAMVG